MCISATLLHPPVLLPPPESLTAQERSGAIDRFSGRETVTGAADSWRFDGASKAVRGGALMDPAVAERSFRPRRDLRE
jgi:hypothetical protein